MKRLLFAAMIVSAAVFASPGQDRAVPETPRSLFWQSADPVVEIVIIDRAAKRFVARYNVDRCVYCAQCIQSCKFKCLNLSKDDWELAALQKGIFEVNYGKEEDVATLLERLALPKAEVTQSA